ncbi:hypothetical protein GUJ93_ZPchr0008g13252 [Zizania palustris]|uniref:Uncharacterized protein n=1 Tax=Zizania palustris TaxID=103762 RepID=A0A8J5UX11_ZIZPA|nr:hypothetical protein GUJ93_ZPchr0008g13252 [Zizania palustris]
MNPRQATQGCVTRDDGEAALRDNRRRRGCVTPSDGAAVLLHLPCYHAWKWFSKVCHAYVSSCTYEEISQSHCYKGYLKFLKKLRYFNITENEGEEED